MCNASAAPTHFRDTAGTRRRSNLGPGCAPHAAQQQAYLEAQISVHVRNPPRGPSVRARGDRPRGPSTRACFRAGCSTKARGRSANPCGRRANPDNAQQKPGGRSANPEDALRIRRTLREPGGRSANPEGALRTRRTPCETRRTHGLPLFQKYLSSRTHRHCDGGGVC